MSRPAAYPDLAGKVALVTGSGQGIGRAIAVALAESGVDIAVNVRRSVERAEETAELVRRAGARASVHVADVTDRKAVLTMVDSVVEEHGRVDICVNNAGGDSAFGRPVDALDPGDWHAAMDAGLTGTLNCCQVVGPHLLAQRSGAVVNISSIAARRPLALWGAYSPSKAAVEMLTRQLAAEWLLPEGSTIRVNAIAPGLVATPRTAPALAKTDLMATRLRGIPMRRSGRPEEIAEVAVFLASERSSFMTGQVLTVDGGEADASPVMVEWAQRRQ